MRDRICRIEENLLQRTAGPYMRVTRVISQCDKHFRFTPISDWIADIADRRDACA